jgi:hypothetical protein
MNDLAQPSSFWGVNIRLQVAMYILQASTFSYGSYGSFHQLVDDDVVLLIVACCDICTALNLGQASTGLTLLSCRFISRFLGQ